MAETQQQPADLKPERLDTYKVWQAEQGIPCRITSYNVCYTKLLREQPLAEIMRQFDPHAHPIVGPLLAGGPAEIVRAYGVEHEEGYADHCHLCYEARSALRERFPEVLAP